MSRTAAAINAAGAQWVRAVNASEQASTRQLEQLADLLACINDGDGALSQQLRGR